MRLAGLDPEGGWRRAKGGGGLDIRPLNPFLHSCPLLPVRAAAGAARCRGLASIRGTGGGGLEFRRVAAPPTPAPSSPLCGGGFGGGGGGDGVRGCSGSDVSLSYSDVVNT